MSLLRGIKNNALVNNVIREVMCGLLRVRSNHIGEENSVLNRMYIYTSETLITNFEKIRLIEDKEPRDDD